ncbi:MAG: hypothetical protein R2912_04325 [Eubacteriales bacterium]
MRCLGGDLLRHQSIHTVSDRSRKHFERAKNVAKAFPPHRKQPDSISSLVDDVTTTHSTLLACAVALKAAGCGSIYAACATAATRGHDGTFSDDETSQ